MAKKSSKKSKKSIHPSFPPMGSPMDANQHPANSVPSPQGGAFDGVQPPGMGNMIPGGMPGAAGE